MVKFVLMVNAAYMAVSYIVECIVLFALILMSLRILRILTFLGVCFAGMCDFSSFENLLGTDQFVSVVSFAMLLVVGNVFHLSCFDFIHMGCSIVVGVLFLYASSLENLRLMFIY